MDVPGAEGGGREGRFLIVRDLLTGTTAGGPITLVLVGLTGFPGGNAEGSGGGRESSFFDSAS